MTAFTRTWNTAYEQVPADTDDASEGAQRIRNSREDTRERLDVDHSMEGDADDGAHKQITLIEQAGDPSNAADRGFLYCKDDSGDTELYYMDHDGVVMQITQDGALNPSLITAAQEPQTLDNIRINATVAANALTIAIKNLANDDPSSGDPVKIAMRDTSSAVGKYNIRSITAALSMVIPQGATLGFGASAAQYIQIFVIDNAGTLELAVGYYAIGGGGMPYEIILYNTTVINSSSDSTQTMYSTTARSSVPIRHIGTIRIQTGSTAGNWSNAPTRNIVGSNTYISPARLPQITTPLLDTGAVDQAALGNAAAGQGELKTAMGAISTTTSQNLTLAGGTYGFYPQAYNSVAEGRAQMMYDYSGGYRANIYLQRTVGTTYAQQRYISASPPYEPFRVDDSVPIFIYVIIDKNTGDVIATYTAVDPPHGNNGPTIINPLGRLQKLAGARMPGMWDAIKDDAAQRILHDKAVDDLDVYMKDPKNKAVINQEMARKFTQAEKNADMVLIPHPFPDFDPLTQVVVVINPTEDKRGRNLYRRHTDLGDSIAEMLHGGYLEIGNTAIPGLVTPPSVMAVTARLKP